VEERKMGKISPVSAKYIIHAHIQIEGVVDRSDVIGSVFGQTEGLLGTDLELRELQRSGRIGRIEVELETKGGKTSGDIIIPSSLDKVETALIAASLETIQRIGPCNSKVKILQVEDVRIAKRGQVIDRAKELLDKLTHGVLPDTKDVKDKVSDALKVGDVTEFGKDRLPAGPDIEESKDIILVEGRADVIALLKAGIKNSIGLNGTSIPQTIVDLCKTKSATVFVDGDRGGDLIVKELGLVTKIDFVTQAPDGKEVEELTQKEILKALRSKVPFDKRRAPVRKTTTRTIPSKTATTRVQATRGRTASPARTPRGRTRETTSTTRKSFQGAERRPRMTSPIRARRLSTKDSENFKKLLEDLVGTKGAYILDVEKKVLGKVPASELSSTIGSLRSGINAIVLDGAITDDIISVAEKAHVRVIVGMSSKVNAERTRVHLVTNKDL
tara:strand:- start:7712 stop:9040 length:1329 start_codon:yes stop_codon:yes gene_type:complete